MQKRNIALCIILCIVTCGIYYFYWYYTIAKSFYDEHTPNSGTTEPVMVVVLNYITCGIYGIYMNYKWGKAMPEIYAKYGLITDDKSIIYVILSIFGYSFISNCIIQNDFNNLIDMTGGVYNPNVANYPPNGNQNYYPNPNEPIPPTPPVPGSPYDVNDDITPKSE